ncbi:hypothetical protein Tco_0836340 [Tanacetum coccineum]
MFEATRGGFFFTAKSELPSRENGKSICFTDVLGTFGNFIVEISDTYDGHPRNTRWVASAMSHSAGYHPSEAMWIWFSIGSLQRLNLFRTGGGAWESSDRLFPWGRLSQEVDLKNRSQSERLEFDGRND